MLTLQKDTGTTFITDHVHKLYIKVFYDGVLPPKNLEHIVFLHRIMMQLKFKKRHFGIFSNIQ